MLLRSFRHFLTILPNLVLKLRTAFDFSVQFRFNFLVSRDIGIVWLSMKIRFIFFCFGLVWITIIKTD